MGLVDILSNTNDKFWIQNPLFGYSGAHPILYTLLYLAPIGNILKTKHINESHLLLRRGITLTRRPASNEHLEMLWKDSSKVISEETCQDYNRLPCLPNIRRGKVPKQKERIICFPYQDSAYEPELVNILILIQISSWRKGRQMVKQHPL